MKKQLLSFYLCAFGILAFAQTTVSIPDDAFEAYLETTFASNITPDGSTTDGSITFVDIDLITDIDFPTGSVTTVADLTGVNSFPRLKNLYCQDNALTGTLDVSGLDQLTNLYCYNNIGLTDLDVSGCTKLYHVKAYGCGFTSLDFSAATLSASDPSGHGIKNKYQSAISLYGVQVNDINNNIFSGSKGLDMHLVVGEPIVNILNNNFYNSEKLHVTGDQKYTVENLLEINPNFKDESFALQDNSALKGKATDGLDLGVISN